MSTIWRGFRAGAWMNVTKSGTDTFMSLVQIPKQPTQEFLDFAKKSKLIAVHGANYSGKSTLSRELAILIDGTHIEVDDFLSTPPNGRQYLEQVKFVELKDQIQKSKSPIILDCFIILDVLAKMDLKPDMMVFCDRAIVGDWNLNLKMEAVYESYQQRYSFPDSASWTFKLIISY
jgi:hypothetical protein